MSKNLLVNRRLRKEIDVVTHLARNMIGIGKITAKKGQIVEPDDILGESLVNVGFTKINIAKTLGVGPTEAYKYLQRALGSKIFRGELLALKKNFLGMSDTVVTSPSDAIVESFDATLGEVRLKYIPKRMPLVAGVYGVVDDINDDGEILIRTVATKIYGVLGSGKTRLGTLKILGKQGTLTTPDLINSEQKQQILVAGALLLPESMRKLILSGVSGIITGGINHKEYKGIGGDVRLYGRGTDVGVSIMATEGFGPIPVGEDLMAIFSQNEGKFVFLSGSQSLLIIPNLSSATQSIVQKTILPLKPQVVIKGDLPSGKLDIKLESLKIGMGVRIIWPPYFGSQGKVVAIDETPTTLTSGVKVNLCAVELKTKKVKVPFLNLEIIR